MRGPRKEGPAWRWRLLEHVQVLNAADVLAYCYGSIQSVRLEVSLVLFPSEPAGLTIFV